MKIISRTKKLAFRAKYNFIQTSCFSHSGQPLKDSDYTFIVAHKNNSEFLALNIKSIHRQSKGLNYNIIIADDCSDLSEFSRIKTNIDSRVTIYRFQKPMGHSFIIEWLFHRTKSPYVVLLDQDALLLSEAWQSLIDRFQYNDNLLVVGMRDKCRIRNNPKMVHTSFIIFQKERCMKAIHRPLFFGYIRDSQILVLVHEQ